MGDSFSRWAGKYIPDPFLFAILLTFVTFVMGMVFADQGPLKMLEFWHQGFWELLKFAMQMCIILVTGYALATTRPVRAIIRGLAGAPNTAGGGVALVAFVAVVAGLVNWGLGLIVGALMAREVGLRAYEKKLPVHYPLLGAAGYAGLAVWHGGLSGSAPLLIASKGHFLEGEIGVIPVSETLLSPLNLVIGAALVVVLPCVYRLLAPSAAEDMTPINEVLPNADELIGQRDEAAEESKEEVTFATRLENSVVISAVLGLAGMVIVVRHFATNGFDLYLNIVNFAFLFLGVILHGTPRNYINAVSEGARGCAGIILQFPFYAGIMGMMKYSGLVAVIAGWFVAISNQYTYPLLTFISAGIINIFVPSGGGQWAVQGPVVVEAAKTLNASVPKCIMALAYGDQWTNLFQPFWALPLLGLTGLKARQIMGYCMVVMLVGLVPFALALVLLPG